MKAGKRYRYYIPCRPKADEPSKATSDTRLPAHQLEQLVEQAWKSILTQSTLLTRLWLQFPYNKEINRQFR